ncbi:tetratricopeptide repeat protein [Streptomyces inhibens]|uniref:tetratricopeptide repeat protein n=1 Tax=Streptomyces inhibens TaxID=2293571 RepID=UPI001FD11B0B|nr:tetratricopeptide repeat protein [Streptomyces inhibens]
MFRETFARNPEDVDFPYLFHVHGNGGVGKSTLVRQWETTAREQGSVVTAFVDDEVADALEAMETISARLGRQGQPLKKFDKQMALYRQRRHQAESAAPTPQGDRGGAQSAPASPSSTVAAQVGLVGLGMLPGVGAFAGAVDPQQVALGADRMRAMLNMRLRSHDDVQLVMRPVERLTPVFLEDLADIATSCERVVLFFDVYERTGPVLDRWLQSVIFGEDHEGLPANVQIVLSGQLRLDTRIWGDRLDQVTEVALDVFTEEEVRTLLAGHEVVDEQSVELVLRLSGRLPLLVDMLARSGANPRDSISDPSETAVERFLKWEPDPQRREAALACALPLHLDEDIYRTVVPEATADDYSWLRALAFVSSQAGRCRYHNVVRNTMLRLQRTRSLARWQQQHKLLGDTFERWRLSAEASLGTSTDTHWDDAAWRDYRLNETYHRLCADPRIALPDALLQAVHATDHDIATLRRWAQILTQAGHDTETSTLTSQGQRLEKAAEEENGGIAVLTCLLTAPELTATSRALAHTVRAREHRIAGAYPHALTDYANAQRVAPVMPRIYAGRAETYRLMGRYDEAIAEFTRAIEIDPCLDWAIASRAQTYQAMERYDEAIADYTRAIEIDPLYAWAIANRGETYRLMGRHDEALDDFTRITAADPQYAWAIASCAQIYQAMGRNDNALAEFARAIEIDPRLDRAIASRGETYRLMGRHNKALADFARAIEINPYLARTIACRAQTYRAMERYDEAIVDYTRAIEIVPQEAWAIAGRGAVYRLMGRYDEALTDFDQAIEIDPQYTWAIASRGETYRLMGGYDEALTDFDQAIEIDPQYTWAIASRAQAYRAMERYDDAFADFARAIQIDPQYTWAVASRGETYRLMGGYDEALADFDQAIEIDPQYTWAIASRGETYHLMGRYGEALDDFTHAIEIDPNLDWAVIGRGETYQAMGRYDEALTEFTRAVEIGSEKGWSEYLRGRLLWSMGREEQGRECWLRAARIFTDAASAGDTDAKWARGNLVVVHCAMSDWVSANAQLNLFLDCAPPTILVREVLKDLADLAEKLPFEASRIRSFKDRLNIALTSDEQLS